MGEQAPTGSGVFGTAEVDGFVTDLLAADHAGASEQITGALRSVLEAGEDLDPVEAGRGLAAVAVLLAEQDPSVLDGAPQVDRLRRYLDDLDTELTPARRVAARGVLARIGVPAANSWYAARSAEPQWPRLAAAIERMDELLADT